MERYRESVMSYWTYNLALMEFRRRGPKNPRTQERTEAALQRNREVAAVLVGKKPLFSQKLEMVEPGTFSEAQEYTLIYRTSWEMTPGALTWLSEAYEGKGMRRAW